MANEAAEKAYADKDFLLAYRLYTEQYKKEWTAEAPPRELVAILLSRAIVIRKLGHSGIAFWDLYYTIRQLYRKIELGPGDVFQQLQLVFHTASSAFECHKYATAKRMAEGGQGMAESLSRTELIAEFQDITRKSVEHGVREDPIGLNSIQRSGLRMPWDDLASSDNLHSEESIQRLNEMVARQTSGAFTVQVGPYGRGLFATKNISKGETFADIPQLISSVGLDASSVCHHCHAKFESGDSISCKNCSSTFCSEACLKEAQDRYHTSLCGIDLESEYNIGLSGALTSSYLTIISIVKIFAEAQKKGITPVEVDCVKDLCVGDSKYEVIDTSSIDAFQKAVSILKIKEGNPQFEFWHWIAVSQRLMANSFGTMTDSPADKKSATTTLGGFITNANHSCMEYNAIFCDNSVTALQRIRRGKELFISYRPDSDSGARRCMFLAGYNIYCECERCGPKKSLLSNIYL